MGTGSSKEHEAFDVAPASEVAALPHSNNQIKQAAKRLRNDRLDPPALISEDDRERLEQDRLIVNAYRRSFQTPLVKVRVGIRSFRDTLDSGLSIDSSRLKRYPRIIGKLVRNAPRMQITKMQDIGGVRLVVPDLAELRRFESHINQRWGSAIRDKDDYVTAPQSTGYRALHIIVERDSRQIEIQLRTVLQNRWAAAVEKTGLDIGHELKWGEGPDHVLEYFRLLSKALERTEHGVLIGSELATLLEDARHNADTAIVRLREEGTK